MSSRRNRSTGRKRKGGGSSNEGSLGGKAKSSNKHKSKKVMTTGNAPNAPHPPASDASVFETPEHNALDTILPPIPAYANYTMYESEDENMRLNWEMLQEIRKEEYPLQNSSNAMANSEASPAHCSQEEQLIYPTAGSSDIPQPEKSPPLSSAPSASQPTHSQLNAQLSSALELPQLKKPMAETRKFHFRISKWNWSAANTYVCRGCLSKGDTTVYSGQDFLDLEPKHPLVKKCPGCGWQFEELSGRAHERNDDKAIMHVILPCVPPEQKEKASRWLCTKCIKDREMIVVNFPETNPCHRRVLNGCDGNYDDDAIWLVQGCSMPKPMD